VIGDLVAVYRAYLRATVAIQLQYRVAMAIWLIGLVVQPVVYLVVWRTVAGSGTVGGYDAAGFAAYYLVLMVVNHVTFSWIMYEYDYEVRQGMLSAKLLKPTHPIHIHLADNVAYKAIAFVVVLPATAGLALYFQPRLAPSALEVGAFLVSLLLAFALRWLIEYTLALAAFWTTRVGAVNNIYNASFWFLSGAVAPTSVLPAALQQVAIVLPFRYTLAFPIEVLLGRVQGEALVGGLVTQVVWVAAAYLLFRLVWRAGLRNYSAVGA
jgi:ABC-2 type transport system permease protein